MTPTTLPRLATALLLSTSSMVVQLEQGGAAYGKEDICVPLDQDCTNDADCLACKRAAATNVTGFEDCQLYYGYQASICVNQAAQACCQAEAAPSNDCLENAAYLAFYGCRLSQDVPGGDCTTLTCDAVGAALADDDDAANGGASGNGAGNDGDDDAEVNSTGGAGRATKSSAVLAIMTGLSAALVAAAAASV